MGFGPIDRSASNDGRLHSPTGLGATRTVIDIDGTGTADDNDHAQARCTPSGAPIAAGGERWATFSPGPLGVPYG